MHICHLCIVVIFCETFDCNRTTKSTMGDYESSVVTVSCSHHNETLANGLWNIFQFKHGADFKLDVGEQSVRVHRLLLDIFLTPEDSVRATEGQQQDLCDSKIYVTLTDEVVNRSSSLNFLLKFLYTGRVTLLKENVTELTNVARRLGFQMLLDAIDDADKAENVITTAMTKLDHVGSTTVLPDTSEIYISGDDDDTGSDAEDLDSEDLIRLASEWEVNTSSDESDRQVQNCDSLISRRHIQQTTSDDPEVSGNSKRTDVPKQLQPCVSCNRPACPYAGGWLDSTDEEPNPSDSPEPPSEPVMPQLLLRCPHCSHKTYNRTTYKHHIYSVHRLRANGQPLGHIFSCNVTECGFECVNASQLKTHHLVKHSGLKPHRCQQCRYASNWKSALNTHIRVVHLRHRPFQCESCGLRLFSQSSLVRHQRTHTGERPFVCSVCGKTFGHPSHFRTHVRLHFAGNERPHICEVCGRTFSRASNLRVHLKIHDK